MDDLADARNNMVDSQLRPTRVNDRRIIDAMRRLPREAFAPAAARALAYADVEVPLGNGRVLLPPLIVARMIQAAAVSHANRVLVIGAGYAAAVFAAMETDVTAIDDDPTLLDRLRAILPTCNLAITLHQAPLTAGWAAAAPYDCIFIDGAVATLPPLGAQLRETPPGRLVAIVAGDARNGTAVVAERAGQGALAPRPIMDSFTSPLPQFAQTPAFHF